MYELSFILGALSEKIEEQTIANIRSAVNGLGGNIKKENIWNKQKLAYPIKKHLFGYYIFFNFEMESEKIPELQKQLRLNGDVLRFLIINMSDVKIASPKPRIIKPKAAVPLRTEEDKGEKVKIEELDKKLEEILKE